MSTTRTPSTTTISIYGDHGIHPSSETKESKAPLDQNINAEFKYDWRFPSISRDYPAQSSIGDVYYCCSATRICVSRHQPKTLALFQSCEIPLRALFHSSYRYYERNGAYSDESQTHADYCCSAMLFGVASVYCLVECSFVHLGQMAEGCYQCITCAADYPKIVEDAEACLRTKNLEGLVNIFDSSSSRDRDLLALQLDHEIVAFVLSYEKTDVSLHKKKQILMYIFERGYSILNNGSYSYDESGNGGHVDIVINSQSNDSVALLDFILATGSRINKGKVWNYLLRSFNRGTLTFEAAAEKAYVLAKYKIRDINIYKIFSDHIDEKVEISTSKAVHEFFNTGKSFGIHKFGLYAASEKILPNSKVSADVVNIVCDYLRNDKRKV